jgi:diguanylate cyclase (GGDEF)-like protein
VTRALPSDAHAPDPLRPSADRERVRVKVARKWAYLLCTTTYVPLVLAELEPLLREMVDTLFAALASEPLDLDAAERVGIRLVELDCADRKSLQCTVDVLAGPLLTDEDVAHLAPERVPRLLGALAAGFTEAVRRRTVDQQESMCHAVMEVARTATRTAEKRRAEFREMSTELSLLRRQLGHQLLHDPLTGLPNRQFFTTRLEEVLNSGSPTTLYRIELNGFSVLNDGLGGPRTDTLLVAIATRLRNAVTDASAMIARVGGAGFSVLHESNPAGASPAEVVGRIIEALAETTYVADLGLALTASIGVVQSPPHSANPVEFMQAGDIALRIAKEQGPGQWRLHVPDDSTRERRSLRYAAAMPGAFETGELTVGYQLRVDLADERPVGVDAYPKWDETGLVGCECVVLAERTGLSPQIGRWLLRTAFEGGWGGGRGLSTWRTALPLSISLSPNQSASPDLVDSVLGTLSDGSLPTNRLRLAMPATEVFDGRPQTMANLTALAKAGVRTAVHDFGGNPSEVVRLPDLPLHDVSLAPRLVEQARTTSRKSLVTKALTNLISLIHEAAATVSVEDVRTRPEIDWWREAGVDTATGPLFPVQGQP